MVQTGLRRLKRGLKAPSHSCTVTSGFPFLNFRGRSNDISCSSRLIVEFQLTRVPQVIGQQRFGFSRDLAWRLLDAHPQVGELELKGWQTGTAWLLTPRGVT